MNRRSFLAASAGAIVMPAFADEAEAVLPAMKLVQLAKVPATSKTAMKAALNGANWFPGLGSNVTWDARGPVYRLNGSLSVLFDVRKLRPNLFLYDANGTDARSGGVRWVAEPPEFNQSGHHRYKKLYISTLEKVAPRSIPVVSGPYPNKVQACVWELDMRTGAIRDLLIVSMYARFHPIDTLTFEPGTNVLLACVGDGGYITSQQEGDPYKQAQNPFSPLGKIVGIPTSPSAPAGRWSLKAQGLRHPMHLNWLPDGRGIITDIGVSTIEKVNIYRRGADYGWSSYDGVPPVPFDKPAAIWDRTGIAPAAICGGPYVSSGPLAGKVLVGDLPSGRIWALPAARLAAGDLTPLQAVPLATSMAALVGSKRVDLRFGHGPNNPLVTSKTTGQVWKLVAA